MIGQQMIALGFSVFLVVIYLAAAVFTLWLAWQFVQAFISIARSLEDIAATYRNTRANPPSIR
jgi:hypothetical protein